MRHVWIECNGKAADAQLLRGALQTPYGHFTTMRVRDGAVRGLDLHLARLDAGTRAMFGSGLDPEPVRRWMRRMAEHSSDCMLRVQVFSRAFDRDAPEREVEPDVLVAAGPVRSSPPPPPRLRSVTYLRDAPHLKHVGTFGLFHQRRLARMAGFDDALFVTPDGAIAEASVWNIGFVAGQRVVWPDAPMLEGVTMRLLATGLDALGIEQGRRRIVRGELAAFDAAFLANAASGTVAVAAIDEVRFAMSRFPQRLLAAALEHHPWQRI